MSFQLTLETLLGFGAPGLLTLVAAMAANDEVRERVTAFFTTPNGVLGIALLVIVFLLGALVEIIRVVLVDPLLDRWLRHQDVRKRKSWLGPEATPPDGDTRRYDYLSWVTEKNLPVFSFILEKTHAYYRFSANVLVVVAGSALLLAPRLTLEKPWRPLITLIVLAVLFRASVKACRDAFWAVAEFSKGEERRCASDSHAAEPR